MSRAAVSKVIRDAHGVSPAMRTRVQDAIEQLAYRPSTAARGLRGASFTFGLELPHLNNPFLLEIAEAAREALLGTPYQLVLSPAAGQEQGAIEALADHRVDGIIAISPLVRPEWLEEVAQRVPLVMVGRHDDSTGYDTVVGDDTRGSRQIMDHLFSLGHRRIVHLTEILTVSGERTGTPHALRLAVYRERMEAAGLGHEAHVTRVENEESEAREATRAILRARRRPTAIYTSHDSLAIGALAAVAEAGLTAQEVSVVGYDNIKLASHPLISLTSVDQSGQLLGQQAVTMLLDRIAGRTEPARYVARPQLIVRGSTAPARATRK